MPDDLMTMDAPAEAEPIATEVDTSTAEVDASTTEESTPETPATEPESGAPPAEFKAVVENGKLAQVAKDHLSKLKAENPALARALEKDAFLADRFRREFPGGPAELKTMRDTLETLGGETGVQEITQELDGWRQFDQQFTAGDPKVLEFLTSEPEAQSAFLQIAPQAFEKFRELNPEGYGAYVAQVFVADMMQEQVPLMMQRLGDFLGDNPKASEVYQKLVGYLNRIGTLAKNPVNKPFEKAQPKGPDPDRQKFEQDREAFTKQQWRSESDTIHKRVFDAEWSKMVCDVCGR